MNRIVIITGAGNGIGLAMTRTLLQMGDRVAALDLSDDNLRPLAAQFPERLRVYGCNVTEAAQVQSAVDDLVACWGQVDVLINNACLAIFEPFIQRRLEDTQREFQVNYFGYLNLIRAVLPHMQKQGHGVIHNVSSGVGQTGFPGLSGYASTKGAIESLTRTLALELAETGIAVNLMHPPLTRTRSASPLGIPAEMMADPEVVGRGLARKVGRTEPVITADVGTALGLWANYHFPVGMGRLLAAMTKRAEKKGNP